MRSAFDEVYISVDVETAGPDPGQYSLLSIGASLVFDPAKTFYVELQPVNGAFTSEALQISGLALEKLKAEGQPPGEAMRQFSDWVSQTIPAGSHPIFVGLNAAFDWMFVATYFHRHLGRNPFGHNALDIKAYYMGMTGTQWHASGFEEMIKHYHIEQALTHNALQDALAQGLIFRRMLEEQKGAA